MCRVADLTIKGFLYQFNLTALEILNLAQDEDLCIEGIVEDIDIIRDKEITAIQCKYHESKENFELSTLYKPVLQMLKTFTYTQGSSTNINYILYAYFPNEEQGIKELSEENLNIILETTNIDYICQYIAFIRECNDEEVNLLISKERKTKEEKEIIKKYFIENKTNIKCNIKDFLENHFKLIIGRSYNELANDVKSKLQGEGFIEQDIEDLFYPNSIQKIAEISIKRDEIERRVNKEWLVDNLRQTKSTAITRWTKELADYNQLLKSRRKQLRVNLNINTRKRCFLFDSTKLENFEDNIVMLINDFISKYCSKVKLHTPSTFCIIDYTKEKLDNLASRIYAKNIRYEDGYRGTSFFKDAFIRMPEIKQNDSWMEFRIRLCLGSDEIYNILSSNKPDDIFLISCSAPNEIDIKDTNVEKIEVSRIEELEYLLQLKEEIAL